MVLKTEKFKCEIIPWGRVIEDAKKLADIIKNSGYPIDIIIAIGRGGYVPARILCDHLLIKDLTSIKVEHWGTAISQKEARIKFPLCIEIKDKNILVVDDVTDTGETLKVSIDYLKTFQPKDIKTAVLVHKICSKTLPDYFVRKVIRWKWIIFPWHVYEDVTEFVKRLKVKEFIHEDNILQELYKLYGIKVSKTMIRKILLEIKNGGEGI